MPYRKTIEQCENTYETNRSKGLTSKEAGLRLKRYGFNQLEEKKKKSIFLIFFEQWTDPMILVLLAGSLLSLMLGEILDSVIILVVVFVNACISVYQIMKAEKALDALKKLIQTTCQVLRDSKIIQINCNEIVPGDIVLVHQGDVVSFDGRIIEASELMVDESSLTGESFPVSKNTNPLDHESQIQDQINMVFSGTSVVAGKGVAIVVATGSHCALGQIAGMLSEEEPKTLLQEKLDDLSKILGILAIAVCLALLVVSLLQEKAILDALMVSLSLAVATIPEGLPAVVTISLALGVSELSKEKMVVRHFHATEALGSVSVICTDKTGTLTQNKLTVVETSTSLLKNEERHMKQAMATCNNASLDDATSIGDPTEIALLKWAENKIALGEKIKEFPFSSATKKMTVIIKEGKVYTAYTKGAIEVVLSNCTHVMLNNQVVPLTYEITQQILNMVQSFTSKAYRVMGCSRKTMLSYVESKAEEQHCFLGFVGMIDPLKEGVKQAVLDCKQANIRVVMITGDHPNTALAIGKDCYIADNESQVMSGKQLQDISDSYLAEKIRDIRIFARVTPADKQRIVKCYRAMGHVVAMTGDGINDAPSLKASNVGIAMAAGTEVTKQAADMVLMDNNFATIIKAVAKGRTITANIKKAVFYLLSCNLGEIVAIFCATLLFPKLPVMFNPAQILWINVMTDAFPALALAQELPDSDVMRQKPENNSGAILTSSLWMQLIMYGLYIGIISLVAFRFGLNTDLITASTMGYLVLSITQLFHSINCRSLRESCFKKGLFTNPTLLVTFFIGIALQVLTATIPFFKVILKTTNLNRPQWLVVFACSMSVILVDEIGKSILKARK